MKIKYPIYMVTEISENEFYITRFNVVTRERQLLTDMYTDRKTAQATADSFNHDYWAETPDKEIPMIDTDNFPKK